MDIVVAGVGLAGVTAALSLKAHGPVLLLGPNVPSVPIAIAHPFAGRSVDVDAEQLQAFEDSLRWWNDRDPGMNFHRTSQVTRSAPAGERLHRSWSRAGTLLPAWLTHQWQDDQLTYTPGLTVRLDAFLSEARQGFSRQTSLLTSFKASEGRVHIVLDDGSSLDTEFLVLCVGKSVDRWLDLTLEVTEGELAYFRQESHEIRIGAGCHSSMSVTLDDAPTVGLGSTYIRGTQDPLALRADLLARGAGLIDIPQDISWYRGTRTALLPSRRPAVINVAPRVVALAGLGSKGLAWAPWLARILVRDHLPTSK